MEAVVKRAAVYTRVSTDDQAAEGTSLATQTERCRAYATSRGWEVVAKFTDEGVSGAVGERPALGALTEAARRGEVDAVIVAKLDRFGRSSRHLEAALGELDDLGVTFASVAESFDSGTPAGQLLRTMLGGFAQFERAQILERTAAGLRARAREGSWTGGPAPYGFRLDRAASGRQRLALRDDEADVLRRATALIVDDGLSTWEAARTLNALGHTPRRASRWVHNHLRRTLLSPTLGGSWFYDRGGMPVEVEVPAVLSPERRAALLDALGATSSGPRPGAEFYLLSRGRLLAPCGGTYHGVSRKARGTRFYRCTNARPEAEPKCHDPWLSAPQVEEAVWAEVAALLSEPGRLLAMARDYLGLRGERVEAEADQLQALDAKVASLEEARTRRAADALRAGLDPELIRAAVAELEEELATVRERRDRLEAWRAEGEAESDRMRRLWALAEGAHARLGAMGPRERRAVLDLLDVRVTVTGAVPCAVCEGKGKVRGGRGGLPCEACRATRRTPSLRIEGVVLDAHLDGLAGGDVRRLGGEASNRSIC